MTRPTDRRYSAEVDRTGIPRLGPVRQDSVRSGRALDLKYSSGSGVALTGAVMPVGWAVSESAHAVMRAAQDAGVWIFGGGVESQRASIVATDGTVTDGPYPETKAVIGGFVTSDVPSREQALEWAARFAVACRCAQEVREIMFDPLV